MLRAANAAQRSAWLVESAVRLYGLQRDSTAPALVSVPTPSYGTVSSAVPCITSMLVGSDGVHAEAGCDVLPARIAVAVIRSARSHAIRYAMNAPLE